MAKKGLRHTEEQRKAKSERMKADYASGRRQPAIKGKSIKALTTPEKWKERNLKISSTRKSRFASGNLVQCHKGKTYEDLFTPTKASRLRRAISNAKSGSNSPMSNLESRQKMIESVRRTWKNGRMPALNNNAHGGFRADLGHYVRSSWEANVCRILKYLNKPYVFEPRCYVVTDEQGIQRGYIPDLLVLDTGIFIEVKGRNPRANRKYELFRKQYPNYFLGLIDQGKYKVLSKKYKGVVPNWE